MEILFESYQIGIWVLVKKIDAGVGLFAQYLTVTPAATDATIINSVNDIALVPYPCLIT